MSSALENPPPARPQPQHPVQPLENGDILTASEFLRRFEAMPQLKKAELIEGTVYMPSAVRYTQHAKPDAIIQGWLSYYSARTPGTEYAPNTTVRLDADDVPQPDALLRLLSECGGRTRVDAEGYLCGPPELIVEIAASSVSIDLHAKLRSYRRASVREYLVWRTLDEQFDWFQLEQDEYRLVRPDAQGHFHSPHFPGLTLALDALLALDAAAVLDLLQGSLQTAAHAGFVDQLRQIAGAK